MLCGYPLGPALCAQALERKPDKQQRGCVSACFLQLSKPHVPGRLHSRSVSRSVFRSVFFFWESIFRHFCCHGLPDTDFPPAALSKYRGIGKQRTAADKAKDSLDSVLYDVCDIMVLIGSYLMLFSILAHFLSRASWIPQPLTALLCGILEMTTGIRQICSTLPACRLPSCLRGLCRIWRNLRNFSDPECHCGFGLHRGQKKCRI